jgi:hypothetical protein
MADSMKFEFVGLAEFEAALDGLELAMVAATRIGLGKAGNRWIAQAQRNASGRPGPNVRSGNLRRGIGVTQQVRRWGAHGWEMHVGPTIIYSRRIELGYNGSRAYPFFEPAGKTSEPEMAADLYAAWAAVVV